VASQVAGPSEPIVFRVRHRDGRWRHLEVMLRDLSDDPEVGGSTVHFRDITPRVEALRRSYFDGLNAREGSAVGIASLREDGRVVRFNDRFAALLGRDREELEGSTVLADLLHPDDRERHRADLTRAVRAGAAPAGDDAAVSSEWRLLRPDGSVRWLGARLLRPGAAVDLAEALVVTVEDVSSRREAERLWALLTPREQDVLGLVGHGWNNRDIAAALHVSVHTVKHHVQGLLRKLDVADRVQAAARVADLGSFPPVGS
ncbi:MAG: DNA-binding response regulator, partial [Marmoricola sp.]|nr:DNA-binding response regulator [Marmoricola sp.]